MAASEECSSDTLQGKRFCRNKMIVDHVQRIRNDHDYVKCVSREEKMNESEEVSIEGIEASDLSSLLEQFLEYEKAVTKTPSLLTPATSPGCCENYPNDQVDIKNDPDVGAPELTPPCTPPVIDAVIQMDHGNDQRREQEDDMVMNEGEEDMDDRQKRKTGESECDLKKRVLFNEDKGKMSDDESCVEEKKNVSVSEEPGTGCKKQNEQNMSKDLKEDLNSDTEKSENMFENNEQNNNETQLDTMGEPSFKLTKRKHGRELKTTGSKCSKCESGQSKRKHRKRCTSTSSSSSSEEEITERYNPRGCESRRDHNEKRSSRYDNNRKHSSRTSSEYYHHSSRRHRSRSHQVVVQQSYEKHCERKYYHVKNVRDIEHERKIDFRLGRSLITDSAKEERRVVYVGGLPYGTTRDELWNRFRHFGSVEKVTVHMREGERDNYGFVTFYEPDDARHCIERGNGDGNERLDLCFGGRRQYCGGSYVDFDSKTSRIEELTEVYGNIRGELPEEDDFDTLLRQCQDLQQVGSDSDR